MTVTWEALGVVLALFASLVAANFFCIRSIVRHEVSKVLALVELKYVTSDLCEERHSQSNKDLVGHILRLEELLANSQGK